MACTIPYIQQEPFSESEKSRLEDIHVSIFKRAKESKAFRSFEGKLYTLKNDYNAGVVFANSINKEYKQEVASIETKAPGQHFLSVDVLPLANEEQGVLFQEAPATIATTSALRTFDFGSLEGQPQTDAKNKAIHNNIVNIPDELMSEEGETFNQASGRVIREMENIVENAPANTVLVTHNSVFGVINLWNSEGRPSEFNKEQREKYVNQDGTFKTGDNFEIEGAKGKIYVVRHGQTNDNLKRAFRSKNTDLTGVGIKEAEEIGKKLAGVKISQIISSPLPRTLHTSNIILSKQPGAVTKANEATIETVKQAADKMGITIEGLADYAKRTGLDTTSINGVADLTRGIIAIATGRESIALTEEVVHFATAILEQTNPQLITTLISKIDKYKVYKQTLEAYKGKKQYQTSDGKPDIRKIKKEAVDKLIAEVIVNQSQGSEAYPELASKEARNIIEEWWNTILDYIRSLYGKSDISIFEDVAQKVARGEVGGRITNIKENGQYFNVDQKPAIDNLYATIVNKNDQLQLNPETPTDKRHYTFNGEKVAKSVTEKVKEGHKMPEREGIEALQDEQKRQWGEDGHKYLENYITQVLIDKDGYKLAKPNDTAITSNLDPKVQEKVRLFAKELINSYPEGTRFLVEKKVVNEKVKGMLASTVDFIALVPDAKTGVKADVLDWKFTSVNKSRTDDIPWYKKKEWNEQMNEYTRIMYNYGLKPNQLGKARMIPFILNSEYKVMGSPKSGLKIESIEIGKLDSKTETNLYLLPVPVESESTGNIEVDKLLKSLREHYEKLYKTPVSPEEKSLKDIQMNEISKAIRVLHMQLDFEPLASVGKTFLNNANKTFKTYEDVDYDKLTQDEIEKILADLIEYERSALKFSTLDEVFLSHFPKEGLDNEQRQLLHSLEQIAASTERMVKKIREIQKNYVVHLALKKDITTEASKETILDAETEIGFFAKTFLEASKLSSKVIKLAANLIINAKNLVDIRVSELSNEYSKLLQALETEAKSAGKSAFEMIGNVTDGGLNLVKKIDKKYYDALAEAKASKNKKWLTAQIDVEKYKEEVKNFLDKAEKRIRETQFSSDKSENDVQIEERIIRLRNSVDLNRSTFDGYEGYDFNRLYREALIEEPHYSEDYKKMAQSKAALDMWNFYTALNKKAREMGYLQNKGLSFFPLIEASLIEKLGKTDNILTEGKDFFKDMFTARIDEETSLSKIDKETGEVRKEIPKLFTRTNKATHQLSTDLNRVGVLWIKALLEYESSKEIENTLLTLYSIEKAKGHLVTDANQEVIFEGGVPKVDDKSNKNADILQTIIDDAIYGLKENLTSVGNVGLGKVTEKFQKDEEEREKTKLSIKKSLQSGNKLTQSLAVGLKLLVTIPNYFGNNMQAHINAGNLYTSGEFQKNNLKLTIPYAPGFSDIQKALLDLFIPLNDNIAVEKRRELAKKQGLLKYLSTWTFHDVMMATNSFPERKLQLANALSILDNTMVVDGKLVNIRQHLKALDRQTKYTLSEGERKVLEKSFEDRVQALKESSALSKIVKVEGDSISIPGVSNEEIAKYRVKIIEYNRNNSGQMSENNKADYRRDTILKSFMMFKGWIPKQISLRTLDIQKNTELGEWEYGRARAFAKTWAFIGLKNIGDMRDIILGTEKGLAILNEMLQEKKDAYYRKTGQQLEITEEEFYDLMRTALSNQIKELILLFSLLGLLVAVKAAAPPDDETDKYTINRYKFWAKAANKITDELWFYYNPLSFESMTKGSVLPSLGLLTKAEKAISAIALETYAISAGDEKLEEKTHPTKYILDLIPGPSQFNKEILPVIDPELAKELGIRVTEQARQK